MTYAPIAFVLLQVSLLAAQNSGPLTGPVMQAL
jgi:hypothetical protein